MSEESDISFSRVNRSGEEMAELRVNLPRMFLAVIDSVAISETRSTGRMFSRTDLVSRILNSYVEAKIEEANTITKVVGDQSDTVGSRK